MSADTGSDAARNLFGCLFALATALLMWVGTLALKWFLRSRSGATEDLSNVATSTGESLENHCINDLNVYKQLYHRLHNLDFYPETVCQSQDFLLAHLSEAIAVGTQREEIQPGLLSVEKYTEEALLAFLSGQMRKTDELWVEYLQRRKHGSPRELFSDRTAAIKWLREHAPLKFVDGAWLGYVNGVETPFAYRHASKDAWQVLSEEYGDGDLDKHHVHLYRKLLQGVSVHLPDAHEASFVHPRLGLDDPRVWKSAVIQLLISLFPQAFLPEILGFNMHYELISFETMLASKELAEVGIDPYYFTIHITIDNADSGHTAIAAQAVHKYIEQVRALEGDGPAETAWRRVQAGYLLSESVASPSPCAADGGAIGCSIEKQLIQILRAKARVSQHIHCTSRLKIGGRSLASWLSQGSFDSLQSQREFLRQLSNLKPWIRRGESRRSLLVKELSWGGRMFGAFTQDEVEVITRWIDSSKPQAAVYLRFANRMNLSASGDGNGEEPVRLALPPLQDVSLPQVPVKRVPFNAMTVEIGERRVKDPGKLVSLWLVHPCLLERFISIPSRTTNSIGCAVVRILRAQNGFGLEGLGVAGMDEARRTSSSGLVELGLELARQCGVKEPGSIGETLEMYPSEFCSMMLALSLRPLQNRGILVGMALAFFRLRCQLALHPLSSASLREKLAHMTSRESQNMQICVQALQKDRASHYQLCHGFKITRMEIQSCF